jgi:hypothetical protein
MSDQHDEERDDRSLPGTVFDVLDVGLTGTELFTDLRASLTNTVAGARPETDALETALGEIPRLDESHVHVSALVRDSEAVSTPSIGGASLPDIETLSATDSVVDAETVVETGNGLVGVSTAAGEQAASVLIDTGSEAYEVTVDNGGEEAAEVVAEAVVAALDGV